MVQQCQKYLQTEHLAFFYHNFNIKDIYLIIFYLEVFLTHFGLVMSYGDRDLGQHWLR